MQALRISHEALDADAARPRGLKLVFAATALMSLGACSQVNWIQDAHRVDPIVYPTTAEAKEAKADKDHYDSINLDKYKFPNDPADPAAKTIKTAYMAAQADPSGKDRNRLQIAIMQLSDRVCEQHLGDIVANAATVNLGLGILSTALAGTATVVGGEAAKSALAAAAAITGASRSLVNEEIYQQFLSAAIVTAIRGERKNHETEIMSRRVMDDGNPEVLAKYPVDDAIRDVLVYHHECSFFNGVAILLEQANRRERTRTDVKARMAGIRTEIIANRDLLSGATDDNGDPLPGKDDEVKGIQSTIDSLSSQLETMTLRLELTPSP